jgi:DNA-binding transcriptional LysR family regulator
MPTRVIDIQHFELIRTLSETGSLSGTAKAMGLSQSAISQQVKLLEQRLMTPVVSRGRRGIELTDAGRILLNHSSSILTTVSLAQEEVSAVAGLRSGKVRIASFPSAAASVVSATMERMTHDYPGISFTLTEAEPPKALELLKSGECDIAVVFNYTDEAPSVDRTVLKIPLLSAQVRVVMPNNHPSAQKPLVSLNEFKECNWIAGCVNCRGHLVSACENAGFSPKIAFETDDYVALQSLAARDLGVALLSDLALDTVRIHNLTATPVDPYTAQEISAITTEGLAHIPAVQQTLTTLQTVSSDASWRVKALSS